MASVGLQEMAKAVSGTAQGPWAVLLTASGIPVMPQKLYGLTNL